ncbi:UNVERIFIED_CONTAM: Zinc finger protein VAR3, chloroplastic [Sesamum radiatum]|uniref:Zinc finger protein VAR3, chloroplastic n=1 Tax=Sesamum radiatum TaxID=300843 RepID=A0AAW2UBU1_SESRA
MALSHLLLRRFNCSRSFSFYCLAKVPDTAGFSSLSSAADPGDQSPSIPKPTSLSARMSFIFEQIDEIDKKREEKDQTLQRIRAWRETKKQQNGPSSEPAQTPPERDSMEELKSELVKSEAFLVNNDVKKEVELVHPWPEWIELMERLVQQNYFDHRRKDEDGMMEGLGFDLSGAATEDHKGLDFTRDFKTVQAAVVNFGRDRFDILRSLSRQDLQILVGYGCPSADKKVVFSGKLLRKHVHLDEGDVCSSCSLRGSCEKAYLLTNKEDEARTIDVMRILLAYGFDPINGSVVNKSLLKMKTVKTVVRKLLHEVVKLTAVPIDPNLPPPVIKRPPPKVKQPPPPPKKRVGRDDIEMKKGDWLCPKCDFMNFAKNTVCLQCDAKRPKRQLLPGEWECPQCNFLNYRRNTVCFHCEHKRPPDTYTESQFPEKQRGPKIRMEKISDRKDISNAWNFDFDDDESDGADVAAFEYADSQKLDEDFPLNKHAFRENSRGHEDGLQRSGRSQKFEPEYSDSGPMRNGVGFNDFDEEEDDDVDSYEMVSQNEVPETSQIDFSELEVDSESEDTESTEGNWRARGKTKLPTRGQKQKNRKAFAEDVELDFDTDDDLPIHPKWKSSHVANQKHQSRDRDAMTFGSDDDDLGFSSGSDDESFGSKKKGNRRGSNGMDRSRRRSSFKDESLSEADSDDDLSYRSDRRRDKAGLNRPGRASRGISGKIAGKKSSANKGFNRSSGPKRNNRDFQENSYGRQAKTARDRNMSEFSDYRRGGSSDKQGRRSNKFGNQSDSYLDEERYRRPRINVR